MTYYGPTLSVWGGGREEYYLFFSMAEGLEAKWLRVTVSGNI